MGTPDFAVPCLDILYNSGYNIVGVITATDKLGGRGGKKLIQSAVKRYATEKNLKVLQPKNLKSPDFIDELKELKADLQVVVAFRMLPELVWDMPRLGTYNLHGSLLPKYRGAAPINWAIINGELETGVTVFKLKHKIDTGDVLLQESFKIRPWDNAGTVHNKMMHLGAKVLLEAIQLIENDSCEFYAQDDTKVTKAPKIYHEDCQVNTGSEVILEHNKVRGLSPYPTAWSMLNGKKIKIFQTDYELDTNTIPGQWETNNKTFLKLHCKDGKLVIQDLQLAGKKRMKVSEFLNGFSIIN